MEITAIWKNNAKFTHAFRGDTADFFIDLVNDTSTARCVLNGYVQSVLKPVQETKLRSDAVYVQSRPGRVVGQNFRPVLVYIAKLQYPLTAANSQHYEVALYK